MRRNSVRKFIHALVDLLPLFIIPIFAININQKSVEPISIEVQQKTYVPKYKSNEVNTYSDIQVTNIYLFDLYDVRTEQWSYCEVGFRIISGTLSINNVILEEAYYEENIDFTHDNIIFLNLDNSEEENCYLTYYIDYDNEVYNGYFFDISKITTNNLIIQIFDISPNWQSIYVDNFFYKTNYNIYELEEDATVTYDNTDIGSQFLYSLYKPINDYFNFNILFNMNDVWNWIQLNLFQGTAPLPVFIVWNIMIYEFFVDLLFLLYAVFMFIIDWSTGLIDKFLGRSRT